MTTLTRHHQIAAALAVVAVLVILGPLLLAGPRHHPAGCTPTTAQTVAIRQGTRDMPDAAGLHVRSLGTTRTHAFAQVSTGNEDETVLIDMDCQHDRWVVTSDQTGI